LGGEADQKGGDRFVKFIGVWLGHKMYRVSCEEYKEMYQKQILEENGAYVIGNDEYVVVGREVVGQHIDGRIKFNKGNMPAWADATGFGVSANRQVVITERPTVEAIDKNKVVIKPAAKVDDLAAEGKAKLEEVVAESQVKTAAVRKKRRPVKKVEAE
jgi:hypothetical protein